MTMNSEYPSRPRQPPVDLHSRYMDDDGEPLSDVSQGEQGQVTQTTALQSSSPLTALPEVIRQVVTDVGLDLDKLDALAPELPLEAAGGILAGLSLLERATAWSRGDFVNYLDERYGEEASQYLTASDYEDSSLAVYSWLCRLYPLEDRKASLTPAHHRVVAKAPSPDRERYLSLAESEGWTVQQLRVAYKPERTKKAAVSSDKAAAYSESRIGQLWTADDHSALCERLS